MHQTLVIGIGNIFRGDDAAGLIAARRLRELELPGVEVLERDGDVANLEANWQGAARVIVVDAVAATGQGGTIHRFEAHSAPLPRKLFATCCSCHAFGLAQQIEVARALGQLPPRLIVYGIEGRDFTLGSRLSPEVAAALPEVVRLLAAEINAASPG
jgi:hydrogenase maturation protease